MCYARSCRCIKMDADSFQERQRELCLLSSFISDHEQWLSSILGKLKWSKDSLQDGHDLVKCPFSDHHYVPSSSLDAHTVKCEYASLGVSQRSLEESEPLVVSTDTLYRDHCVPCIEIDPATEGAVRVCAQDPDLYKDTYQPSGRIRDEPAGLEDSHRSGIDVSTLQPQQVISFIKSWRRVPPDWAELVSSSLTLDQVKGWLFQNLPREHAHSGSVGGEMVAVDSILHSLGLLPGQLSETSITPNTLLGKLKPLFRSGAGQFVLSLWKYLHISLLQSRYTIPDSTVEDIAPMPLSQQLALRGLAMTDNDQPTLVLEKIKEIRQREGSPSNVAPPLPMEAQFYTHTPLERRVMYDYVVEASRPRDKKMIDPDLFRDDAALLKAKLKAEAQQDEPGESRSYQEVLRERKEKRDYKRRRQKYRAKNVHITRRTTSEIFRDIINNRMEEILESLATREDEDRHSHRDDSRGDTQSTPQRTLARAEDETKESSGKKRRRSRSKSREEHHSHRKHKKHKKHHSREHRRQGDT